MENVAKYLMCQIDCNETCDMMNCHKPCVHSINLSNDYILIFDNNKQQLINLNNACLKTLKDESLPKNKLLGHDIFFFVPELKEPGAFDYYVNIDLPERNSYFSEDYNLKAPVNADSQFVKLKINKTEYYTVVIGTDITSQKIQEQRIIELSKEYENLKNTLDILLNHMNEKNVQIEKNYYRNLENMLFPLLDILKCSKLDKRQVATLDTLEENLKTITQPFNQLNSAEKYGFTQREIQISQFILSGKTSKEIADILCLSTKTVDFHRASIRKKLNINNSTDNLRITLQSLS